MCTDCGGKDWALSMLTCGFPLGDEPEEFCSPSNGICPRTNRVSPKKKNNKSYDTAGKKAARGSRRHQEGKSARRDWSHSSTGQQKRTDDSSWPHFADEDYIVFCIGEDGAFDVAKDVKSKNSRRHHNRDAAGTSRLLKPKLMYADDGGRVDNKKSHENKSNEKAHEEEEEEEEEEEGKPIILDIEGEVEKTIYIDSDSALDGNHGMRKIDMMDNEEGEPMRVESCGSNQSDSSGSSFAFPVLRWEWVGSPIQMPKSDGLQLRKQKARHIGFYCCGS
ncbi:protein BREAKING OF ASYMMETRY IN THE STOMATAL LINEAGE [Malania oleifera]|uniref:protein BREAKING OF ASYMMETRY IN THE STOMATAL LINEAGE n=1 Tax=Malania oleifera TaxID=397392 RepID=UPI0025AE8031|nr:protein BREAKING OF ASYMMETRY IN THE STOMATAL LINEAGE [Malania oleifera]